jgi:hypothetical protein
MSSLDKDVVNSTIKEFSDPKITSKPKWRILQPSLNKTKICSTCKVEKNETNFQLDLKGNCKQICRQCTPKKCIKFGGDKMIEFEKRKPVVRSLDHSSELTDETAIVMKQLILK